MISVARTLRSGLAGLAILAAGGLAAIEENPRYLGEPTLAQISLAGSVQVIELAPVAPEDAGNGERVYRPLQIHRGDQPLVLTLASARPDTRPVVRLMTRLQGWETEWQDNDGFMYLMLRYLDENNR
ncbi:MAG: hypothetical protein PSW75_00435, partial [bacterium]|nr:hypothetical protein [bacterium]